MATSLVTAASLRLSPPLYRHHQVILCIVQVLVVQCSQRLGKSDQQQLLGSSHRHQRTVTSTLYHKLSCHDNAFDQPDDLTDKAIQMDST